MKILIFLLIGALMSCSSSTTSSAYRSSEFNDIKFDFILDKSQNQENFRNFILKITPVTKDQRAILKHSASNGIIDLQEHLKLISGKDTISCTFFNMEPMLPDNTYRAILSFELEDDPKNVVLLFNAEMFNKSQLQYNF